MLLRHQIFKVIFAVVGLLCVVLSFPPDEAFRQRNIVNLELASGLAEMSEQTCEVVNLIQSVDIKQDLGIILDMNDVLHWHKRVVDSQELETVLPNQV